jgi:O-antigen ligase
MRSGINQRIVSLALLAGILGTISVNPFSSFDPINPIKILIISTFGFAIFGLLFSKKILKTNEFSDIEFYLFSGFIFMLLIPLFFANAPTSQQFWGVFGRNTGFLAYVSLAIIALGISQTRDVILEIRVVKALVGTSSILAVYGLVQAMSLEFINWSQKSVFATLGNVNFFSAFLGISLVMNFTLLAGWKEIANLTMRTFFILLFLLQAFLVLKTDSIQGIVTAVVGIFLATLLLVSRIDFIGPRKLSLIAAVFTLGASALGIRGLFGDGPLAKVLSQDSNFFRLDYMHAAIEMAMKNPFNGVGLDSYDNWYRTERGFISAYRTGINRSSNSAHNIYLDLAAGGGLLLLLSYLLILILVIYRISILLKNNYKFSTIQIALICSWAAYQFQALISINQIGLGIWGWILTGTLLSFLGREIGDKAGKLETIGHRPKDNSSKKQRKKVNVIHPLAAILAVIGLFVGFALAYIPFSTDVAFRKAFDSRDVSQMKIAIAKPGSNAFQQAKTLEAAIATGDNSEIINLARELTQNFPREIFGWDVIRRSPNLSASEIALATQKLQNIDPNIFCFSTNPTLGFLKAFDSLRLREKYELLGWWGFVDRRSSPSQSAFDSIRQSSKFNDFVSSLCG